MHLITVVINGGRVVRTKDVISGRPKDLSEYCEVTAEKSRFSKNIRS